MTAPSPDSATGDPRPAPEPDDTSRFFWSGAAEGRLMLQRCAECEQLQYPPDVACVQCQSIDLGPTQVSGRAELYSYTVVDRAFHVGFAASLPYVVGIVELVEQPGLRMLTNIVDAELDALRIGMPLAVTFESRGAATLPQFRPAADA